MNFLNLIENKIHLNINEKFALIIGSTPSKGARSPKLWNRAYKKLGQKTKMYPADVREKNLKKICLELKKNQNFLGSSVTVPYKEKIMQYLDKIDKKARDIGSINTIKKNKNNLFGYNTDYYGALFTLKTNNIPKKNNNIIILGCGGAGKAIIKAACDYFSKSKIYLLNRNFKKLKFFSKKLVKQKKNKIIILDKKNLIKINDVNIILNSTSVGFNSWIEVKKKFYNLIEFSPLTNFRFYKIGNKNFKNFKKQNKKPLKKNIKESEEFLSKNKKGYIFDAIYNPKTTLLMKIAKKYRYKVINGLDMNLMQAVEGFKLVNSINNRSKIKKAMHNG
tara:strand:+ start:1336 stop:2337 length:1002 start_codon:yes stop_codon:yes gene_type:complete